MPSPTSSTVTASSPPSRKRIPAGSKRAAVLRKFIERGELGMNCFEAVRLCHDYVLRSSISDYTRLYGIMFARKREQVPGHAGSVVECVRYWLTPASIAEAELLLAGEGAT